MISLLTPAPGAYIGQGIVITIDVGAAPAAGDFVFVTLNTTSTQVCSGAGDWSSQVQSLILGLSRHGPTSFSANNSGAAVGDSISMSIVWFDHLGNVKDNTSIGGFFHDPNTGISNLFNYTGGSGGGLTPTQDATLNTINLNTQAGAFKFPFIGVTTTVGASENPVIGGSVIDLVVPSIPGVQVVGLTWEATTVPDLGVGIVGVIQEASRRAIQAVVFHTLAGGATFADQVEDSRQVTGAFFFDSWDPSGVSVYVWPGFVLNLSWLIFP